MENKKNKLSGKVWLYIIPGAFVFAGIFDSVDFFTIFWNRFFIFTLAIIVG